MTDETNILLSLCRIENCINDVRVWMVENLLKINDDKTVALVLGARNNQAKYHITVIKIGDCNIMPSPAARNIGAVFDSKMSMVCHVKYTCRIAYYHLRNIASIRSCLTQKTAVRLIYSLVISRIDYANSLLHGIPDCLNNKLQRVQNVADRLVVRCHRWDHIAPVLKKLHWLLVKQRIHYVILLLAFRAQTDWHQLTQLTSSTNKELLVCCVRLQTMICMCRHLVADTVTEHSQFLLHECGMYSQKR